MKSQHTYSYEQIQRLGECGSVDVRRDLAGWELLPPKVLHFLAQDPAHQVRTAVAKNRNTPIVTLELLAIDKSKTVRKATAENLCLRFEVTDPNDKSAWDGILKIIDCLSQDEDESVAEPIFRFVEQQQLKPSLGFRMMDKLIEVVAKCVERRIQSGLSISHELESGALKQEVISSLQGDADPDTSPQARARSDVINGLVNEDWLSSAIVDFDIEYSLSCLAIISGLRLKSILHIMEIKYTKAIMALAWTCGFSAKFGLLLQRKVAKVKHVNLLYPKMGVEYPLTTTEMEKTLERFA